jgi:hypothetical protein
MELEKMTSQLSRANDNLFSAEKAKLQAEEKFNTANAKLSRLEKDSEEKDRKISMVLLLFLSSFSFSSSSSSNIVYTYFSGCGPNQKIGRSSGCSRT